MAFTGEPLPFSHKRHAALKVECAYCHEKAAAGEVFPSFDDLDLGELAFESPVDEDSGAVLDPADGRTAVGHAVQFDGRRHPCRIAARALT